MHPAFCEGLEFAGPRASRAAGYWQLDWTNEISALDLRSGAYRETLPPRAPLHLVLNGEPEEIFVESVFTPESRVALRVGGDRPELLAYSHDMTFAWVGESRDTLVVDCATGRPVVYPAHADAIECDDAEAPEDCGGNALGFGEGHFWFLWYGRWLANHLADSPVRLPWTSRASAFDREARRLALVVGDEILVVDREGFTVRARFPLPARS
jgi:hypothetical protein